MTDLYLKATTEADMTAVLLEAGIVTEQTVKTEVGFEYDGVVYEKYTDVPHTVVVDAEGYPIVSFPRGIETLYANQQVLVPAQGFSVDQIGPFTRDDVEYPDWHTNLRGSFDEDQLALLTPLSVEPPVPYRVWA